MAQVDVVQNKLDVVAQIATNVVRVQGEMTAEIARLREQIEAGVPVTPEQLTAIEEKVNSITATLNPLTPEDEGAESEPEPAE